MKSIYAKCREVLDCAQESLLPSGEDYLKITYPWRETPRSSRKPIEGLVFNTPPRELNKMMARLSLQITKDGEMPLLNSLVLNRGNSTHAHIAKTITDYTNIVGNIISDFPFKIEDLMRDLLTDLGISRISGQTPPNYRMWISETLTLPLRKIEPKSFEDLMYPPQPTANDWERSLTKRLDDEADFSDPIRATFFTKIKGAEIRERRQLSWDSLSVDKDGRPIQHTETIIFPETHGERDNPYAQILERVIDKKTFNHPAFNRPENFVKKDAVRLASRILDAINKDN